MANELPTKNFLTRLSELKLESGTTGSARFRRIPLFAQETTEAPVVSSVGAGFIKLTHFALANSQTDIVYYWGVVVPSDLVPGSIMKFRYMYSSSDATDTIDWVVVVKAITEGTNASITLLSDTSSVAAPSVVDTISTRRLDLTLLPKKEDVIFASIQRSSGDANTGLVSLWSVWLEYLAHS